MLLANLSKKEDEGVTWWERAYRLTPSWLVPFVREAGFTDIEREFVSSGLGSEVVVAKRPL